MKLFVLTGMLVAGCSLYGSSAMPLQAGSSESVDDANGSQVVFLLGPQSHEVHGNLAQQQHVLMSNYHLLEKNNAYCIELIDKLNQQLAVAKEEIKKLVAVQEEYQQDNQQLRFLLLSVQKK